MPWYDNQLPVIGGDLIQIDQMKRQNAQDERRNALADIAMQRGEEQYQQQRQDRLSAEQRQQAEQALSRAQWAKGKPKAVIERQFPEVTANFERQTGIPWAQADEGAVAQFTDDSVARLSQGLGLAPPQEAQPRYTQVGDSLLEVPTKSGETPRVAFTAPQKQGGTGTLYKVQTSSGPRYVTAEEARGLPPAEDAPAAPTPKSAMQLRKEFESLPEVKDFKVILPQLVSARKAPDTGAGDLQMVYTVAKLLDPQSVVRESETAMVLDSTHPMARIFGTANFMLGGNGRLTPGIRKQMLDMLNERALATRRQYDAARKNFDEYAQQSGFDRQWVTGTHPAASVDPSARLGAAPARQEAPPSAVEFLRKNPQTKAAFKAKYGYLP